MLVYKDLIFKLDKDLFFILMLVNLLRSGPELSVCASLIIPNSGDNVLPKSLTILWAGGGLILCQRR